MQEHEPASEEEFLASYDPRAFDPVAVGCAQIIAVEQQAGGARCLVAASDPRSPEGAAVGR